MPVVTIFQNGTVVATATLVSHGRGPDPLRLAPWITVRDLSRLLGAAGVYDLKIEPGGPTYFGAKATAVLADPLTFQAMDVE
jgi:hypothetical protein